MACSILSSNVDMPVSPRYCFAAEVGLSGEIRPISRIGQRIGEAQKLGFKRMIMPASNLKGLDSSHTQIELVPVSRVEEALRNLFG